MLEEKEDGICYIQPPPVQCPRCKREGLVAIGHNEYYEGYVNTSKKHYFEMFYKCIACNYRLASMSAEELAILNGYPRDKQMWPKAMQHKELKGKMVR